MSTWEETMQAWSSPPVDDVGYIPTADMLTWPDAKLKAAVEQMRVTRYHGWRNHNGLWRRYLGLDDDQTGMRVLEYGCGVGMEAAEIAKTGARLTLADLSPGNIGLASRVIRLVSGTRPHSTYLIHDEWPYVDALHEGFEQINCSGVLHHIRKARLTLELFYLLLVPGGRVRLMVYSDQGWRLATGTEPPPEPVEEHPAFGQFVRWMDGVGDYATWYDAVKIDRLAGDLFELESFDYLTPDGRYCAAVLKHKGP